MAHIVCITSGLTGILHASFAVVAALEEEGHRLTYACPQPVGARVTAQGFDYVQLPPVNFFPEPVLPEFKGKFLKVKRLAYKWKHKKNRRQLAVAALGMDGFEQEINRLQADLFIVDIELHEHIMLLVAQKKRVLLMSQWFSLWHRKGLPPLLHATIPGKNWRGSPAGLAYAWSKIKAERYWIFLKQKWRSGGTDRRSVLQLFAKKIGFPARFIRENYWPGPFSYAELPVISLTAREMEFPHDIRPNLYYVGPMVFDKRKDIQTRLDLEKQLDEIIANAKRMQKKLIYCSVSTYRQGDKNFLQKIVQAIAKREDWQLIIGLGGLLDTDFLPSLPPNVHVFGWIPQLRVLAAADLSINHGGIHTIHECLHFGVPMLVYSGKKSDQNGCAARVHFHQLGIMADKDIDDVATIENNIERLFNNEIYQQKVAEMQKIVDNYRQEKILVQLVDQILNN